MVDTLIGGDTLTLMIFTIFVQPLIVLNNKRLRSSYLKFYTHCAYKTNPKR